MYRCAAAVHSLATPGSMLDTMRDRRLRAWPKLRGWLEDDQTSWIVHSRLASDAADWHHNHADPSFLHRGSQLTALQRAAGIWSADPGRYPAPTSIQHGFLRASEQAAARSTRQRRSLAAALVVLLAAALTGAGLAATAARRADQQRSRAVSAQLAAESEDFDAANPVQASMLAAATWQAAHTAQARESMLEDLAQPERAVLAGGRQLNSVAVDPAGRILAAGGAYDRVRLWDVATHRQIGAPMRASTSQGVLESHI
jgi:hypothetical protein